MIWKIVIIILCLLWCLPIVYVWFKTKRIKDYEDYLDNESDYYDATIRAYEIATKEIKKDFVRLDDAIENQRKIVNGWQHKIEIMDCEIRKLKKEMSNQKE